MESLFWGCFLLATSGAFARLFTFDKYLWLIADVLAVYYVVRTPQIYTELMFRLWPLFLWPLLAVLSSLWSQVPSLSFYHGLQLTATMLVGVVLAVRLGLERTLKIVFWSSSLAMVTSLAVVGVSAAERGVAWQGVFTHKNTLGGAMVGLITLSLVLCLTGWRRGLTVAVILGAFTALVGSRSGTAVVLLAGSVPLIFFLALCKSSAGGAAFGLIIGFLAITVALIVAEFLSLNLVSVALDLLGKDATLTGRTVLWEYAWLTIMDHPWLGIGYKAYFASPETSGSLLRYILQQTIPYLHNNFLEVAVAFGSMGVLAFVIGLISAGAKSVQSFARERGLIGVWSVVFMVQVLVACMTENPLFYNHSLAQVMIVLIAADVTCKEIRTGHQVSYGTTGRRPRVAGVAPHWVA